MTRPAYNQDGYESALLGGVRRDAAFLDPRCDPITLYASGGLYARVVDLPADKALSRGVEFEGDDDGISRLRDELDRLAAIPALANAMRYARLTGGGGIIVLADDGTVNEPLDAVRLRRIEELRVLPLTAFAPTADRYTDPTKRNFGEPVRYEVSYGGARFRVHETRVIPVSGGVLPAAANLSGVPWAGRSEVARAYPAIRRYIDALGWANSILQRKQQAVYGMVGLADMIAQRLEGVVQARINLVDSVRGVLNTVAIDSEDSYRIEDMNLGGIRDVIAEHQVAVSAETGVPVNILFGTSPAGLNATGRPELITYHEMIAGFQQTRLGPALERLGALIFAQSSFARPPEDWRIVWPPLDMPTEEERAKVRQTNAQAEYAEMQALQIAVNDVGAVSEEQAADYVAERGLFGVKPKGQGDEQQGAREYAAQTA